MAERKRKTTRGRKTRTVKSTVLREAPVQSAMPTTTSSQKRRILIGLFVILILLLLYYFRGIFVVAVVNGQPITHLALIQELEKRGGQQTLKAMIDQTLIYQEAAKKHVSVSDTEINTELKKFEKTLSDQGQKLDSWLVLHNMTKADLVDQIRLQKLVEKLLAKNIQVSDKEVNDYIANYKDSLPKNLKPDQLRQEVKDQIKTKKLQDAFPQWLSNLEKQAKISQFVNF